jgi:hypothetical protein
MDVSGYSYQKKAIENEFTEFFRQQVMDSTEVRESGATNWIFYGEILAFSHNFQITVRNGSLFTVEFAEKNTDVIHLNGSIHHSTGIIEEEDVKIVRQALAVQNKLFNIAFWSGTKEELAKLQIQWAALKAEFNEAK